MTALALVLAMAAARPSCLAAESDAITAGLLAAAVPELGAADAAAVFGYAPAPGLIRWLRASEIRAFARRHGLEANVAGDVCVERASKVYTAAEVEAALRAALAEAGLNGQGVLLELVDHCRIPMPPGRLSFALREIGRGGAAGPEAPLAWRGRVIDQGGRSAPFWASVRLSVRRRVLAAAKRLDAGRPIADGDLTEVERAEHPLAALARPGRGAIVGRAARRPVAEGTVIESSMLAEVLQVRVGDDVEVTVESGPARLKMKAKAVTAGRRGERILLENTQSRKLFRASVSGPGQAAAGADAAQGPAAQEKGTASDAGR